MIMSRTYEQLNEQESKSETTTTEPPTNKLPATPEQHRPVNDDDGWNDAAAEMASNVIRGTLLKFADWKWTKGTEAIEVKEGTQLVALGTAAAWVKWKDAKPVEYRMRQSGTVLADREELGDLDQASWEIGPDDAPRDPWANTRFVYLLDPISVEMLTYSTSSWGGRAAVSTLADQITRMRGLSHANAAPIVELGAAPMQTKFGRKSKPIFKIIKWYGGAGGEPKEITAAPSLKQEMSDEIPF
jgi:hypothetical protein